MSENPLASLAPLRAEEFDMRSTDGTRLFARHWPARDEILGAVGVVHGLGEHSGRYGTLARSLTSRGFHVLTFDLHGHGRSPGPRGVLPDYERVLDSVELLHGQLRSLVDERRCFLLGQSMGANLVLNYALRRRAPLGGLVALSPMLRLAGPMPKWKRRGLKWMAALAPNRTIFNGIRRHDLSRMASSVNAYKADPLVHRRISFRFADQLIDSGEWALENAKSLRVGLLLMHGDGDHVTSVEASHEFAEATADLCTFEIAVGSYHELLWEISAPWARWRIVDWLNQSLAMIESI